jgi:hypothetical protein
MALDMARFQGDLGRAAAITERRMKNIKETSQRAFTALTLAATAAGGALVTMVSRSLKAADDVRELAMALGTTTEELSGLIEAASRSGLSQDQIATGMKRLSANAIDAAKGVGEASKAFKALGISVKREDGTIKSSGELIREMADKFSQAPDGITKTALAMAVFGKEGAAWIPFLNEGSVKIDALIERLARMGVVISTETGVAADQFLDNLKDLKDLSSGFSRLLAAELAPSLANVTGELVRDAQGFDTLKASAEFFADFVRVIVSGLLIIKQVLSELGKSVGGLAAAFAAAARGDFREAWDILGQLSEDGAIEQEKFITGLLDVWDKTAQQTSSAAPRLGAELAAPAKEAAKLTKEAVKELERYHNQARQMVIDANRLKESLYTSFDTDNALGENTLAIGEAMAKIRAETLEIPPAAELAADSLSVFAEQGARNLQSAFADFLFDPFEDGLKGMLRGFIDTIRRMVAEAAAAKLLEGVSGFLGSVLGGLFGAGTAVSGASGSGLSSSLSGFRAMGGPVSGGRSYVVGENGAEIFRPGTSGMIYPNGATGQNVNVTIGGTTINAPNADASVLPRLSALIDQKDAALEAKIIDGFRRNRYRLAET